MKTKTVNNKVLIALSGGVDSSVAAAILVKQGYDVTAAYMINYNEPSFTKASGGMPGLSATASRKACWVPDYRDAVRVSAKLNIPILKLDFIKEYKKAVLDYMFKEYESGRTPNPDVMCNKFIKFGVWLKKAQDMGFNYLATGHYARIASSASSIFHLFAAKDTNKDQTYFLHQLSQKQLQHVMFPIGNYTKPHVRNLAKQFNLPTAKKEESMGICFVGEVPMKEFLGKKIKPKPGNVVLSNGTILGQHDGLAFYTIGQRHINFNCELPIVNYQLNPNDQNSKPVFVVEKRLKTNELVVGFDNDPLLYKKEIIVSNVNWIAGLLPKFPLKCQVRLRHRQPLQYAKVKSQKSKFMVEFDTPQRAVTPGQFAVFYKKGECLGGGEIL